MSSTAGDQALQSGVLEVKAASSETVVTVLSSPLMSRKPPFLTLFLAPSLDQSLASTVMAVQASEEE